MNNGYREDSNAAAKAAEQAALRAERTLRMVYSLVVIALIGVGVFDGIVAASLHKRIEMQDAKLTLLEADVTAMGAHDPAYGEAATFHDIAAKWSTAPCDPKYKSQGDVLLNGISMGEETCRVDRLERIVRAMLKERGPDGGK